MRSSSSSQDIHNLEGGDKQRTHKNNRSEEKSSNYPEKRYKQKNLGHLKK